MRIVGGRLRGRTLAVPPGEAVRPTSDRAREAIFNILMHNPALCPPGRLNAVQGAIVLDAFAGSGAMGLEALSRGAARLTLMENDAAAGKAIEANLRSLGLAAVARLLRVDAANPPPRASGEPACDLLFLDPPYGQGLAERALAALSSRGWIAPAALCIVETGPHDRFSAPDGFTPLLDRRYGRAHVDILRALPDA